MKKQILTLALAGFATLALTGCGAYQGTASIPSKYYNNSHIVYVDVDNTAIDINPERVSKANFPYLLAVAATTTKDKGFKYFKIIEPKLFAEALKDNKITTSKEAIDMCNNSGDKFAMHGVGSVVKNIFTRGTGYLKNELEYQKSIKNRCAVLNYYPEKVKNKLISYTYAETTAKGTTRHYPLKVFVKFTNVKQATDYDTFEANEIINSKVFKELDQNYVVPKD